MAAQLCTDCRRIALNADSLTSPTGLFHPDYAQVIKYSYQELRWSVRNGCLCCKFLLDQIDHGSESVNENFYRGAIVLKAHGGYPSPRQKHTLPPWYLKLAWDNGSSDAIEPYIPHTRGMSLESRLLYSSLHCWQETHLRATKGSWVATWPCIAATSHALTS